MKRLSISSVRSIFARLAISAVLAITAGCGGDGGSGVDRSKALTAVTPAEADALCQAADEAINEADAVKLACYISAILASQFDPSIDCETTAQDCIANPEPVQSTCDIRTQADIDALPACAATVTVGQFEDCQVAMADALSDLAQGISCTSDLSGLDTVPAACQTIQDTCPELFGEAP